MEEKRVRVPLVIVIIVLIVIIIAIFSVSGAHSSPIWNEKVLSRNRRDEFRFLIQTARDDRRN